MSSSGIPEDLRWLLQPQSIAIVGASDDFGKISGMPLKYLRRHGYPGAIFPVNPKYHEVAGIRCYPSLNEVPNPIDLALITLGVQGVLPVLEACARKQVRSAVVVASGFGEVGGVGAELQGEISRLAATTGLRVLGPNCQGFVNVHDKVAASFTAAMEAEPLVAGTVALVTQSGALGGCLLNVARERRMGLSYWVSTGNEADLSAVDVLQFFLRDPRTKVVAAYLEGIKQGDRFVSLADEALTVGKPLIVLKVGSSQAGRRAALSHTGALTGSRTAYEALCKGRGIIGVEDLDEVLDTVALLAAGRPFQGGGLGIITSSGGAGVLLADQCEALQIPLAEFTASTEKRLRSILPAFGSATNPVDTTAQILTQPSLLKSCLEVVLADPGVGALAILLTMVTGGAAAEAAEAILEASMLTDKPVVVGWMAGEVVRDAVLTLQAHAIPVFATPLRLAKALRRLWRYGHVRERLLREIPPRNPLHDDRCRQASRLLVGLKRPLAEHESAVILALYNLPVARQRLVISPEEAVRAAEEIGFPVALKVQSPQILHKSDVGALCLNLAGPEAVRAAYQEILEAARSSHPQAEIQGVLVQEMLRG
ncbi:MAG: acetate--CoA ligase family protein, partial [candidate division NC10 bacterium]|nr:acetate--CoA ligase family protein [candidate division NC10 bacterium]